MVKAQRNIADQPEMSENATSASNKKTKNSKNSKTSNANASKDTKENASKDTKENANASKEVKTTLGAVPEGSLITSPSPSSPAEQAPASQEKTSSLKFCTVCDNYLYMQVDSESQELTRLCRKCGYKEQDTTGGLVMEMMIQEDSAEGYKVLLNEFTRKDPRLPHIRKNITCPNLVCDSNKGGKDPDVIYIKYDLVNMMYLYICDICGEKWHTRSRN
jgi:DNA-directed RNA polymerase subunit M/transcription elongation factor TFIIS